MDALHDHLVGRAKADLESLDLDAARAGQRRFRLSAPGRVVAVADEHDPLLCLVREQRRGEAQRAAHVRGARGRHGCESVKVLELRRQALHECFAAEGHDRRAVTVRALLERVAHERQRGLAAGIADAVREVDHEHGCQPVHRPDEGEAGQRQHERAQDDGAQEQRDAPPAAGQVVARGDAQAERDGEQEQPDDEQLGPADAEGQAHVARPVPSARRRPASGLAARSLFMIRRAPSRS